MGLCLLHAGQPELRQTLWDRIGRLQQAWCGVVIADIIKVSNQRAVSYLSFRLPLRCQVHSMSQQGKESLTSSSSEGI